MCNDYLIINNLLYGKADEVLRGIEIAHKDAQGVMQEAIEQGVDKRWGLTLKEGQILFKIYKKRYPHKINKSVLKNFIKRAWKDYKTICGLMKPSDSDIILYRNVRISDALPCYIVGDIIELKGLNSTSLNPCNQSYGKDKAFIRYEISLPKGTPMLVASNYPIEMNEPDEVILPPIECRITFVHNGEGDCQSIIGMDLVDLL